MRIAVRKETRAFTLVELLVVISIIALLIAILLPSLQKARAQAKALKCQTQLRNFAFAIREYSDKHNGRVPLNILIEWSTEVGAGKRGRDYPWPVQLVPHVSKRRETFLCPSMDQELWPDVHFEPNDDWEYFEQTPQMPCSYEMKIDIGTTRFDPNLRKNDNWEQMEYFPPEHLPEATRELLYPKTPKGNSLPVITLLDRIPAPMNVMLYADRYWWHKDNKKKVKRQLIMADGHCDKASDVADQVDDSEYFQKFFYYNTMARRIDLDEDELNGGSGS